MYSHAKVYKDVDIEGPEEFGLVEVDPCPALQNIFWVLMNWRGGVGLAGQTKIIFNMESLAYFYASTWGTLQFLTHTPHIL